MDSTRRIVVGRVGAPVGLAGAVRVWSFTVPPEALLDYGSFTVRLAGQERTLEPVGGATRGRSLVLNFSGVADRDAAARLTGVELAVARGRFAPLPAGEYYWADLEGLAVVDLDGQRLGSVASLMETGANDVLVVRDGSRERLIPYLRDQVIRAVDLAGGTITVDWAVDWDTES